MEYLYYPGCSLECSGRAYDESLRSVFKILGVKLTALEDWNCCGATMYMSVDEAASMAISARNLALAERNGSRELIAPCSACYTVLLKTNRFLRESPELKSKVDVLLAKAGLTYNLSVRVRHPLDVLVNDIGIEGIGLVATTPLNGISFAPYYGCQIVRPERGFDDQDLPSTMDRLFERLGARAVYFPWKTKCCGGMLMTTFSPVALQLVKDLLNGAAQEGADCILTTCPMCQINLECYQERVNKLYKTSYRMPVVFFTQLLGLALGCPENDLGLHRNLVPFERAPAAVAG